MAFILQDGHGKNHDALLPILPAFQHLDVRWEGQLVQAEQLHRMAVCAKQLGQVDLTHIAAQ